MNRYPIPPLKYTGRYREDELAMPFGESEAAHLNLDALTLELVTSAQDIRLDLNEVQLKIANGMKSIFQAESVSLYLFDAEEQGYFFQKTVSSSSFWCEQKRTKLQSGLVWACIQDGLVKSDALTGSSGRKKYVICIPLSANGQKLGAVEMITYRAQLPANEIRLLRSITTTLSNAIQTRRVFSNLNSINQELETSRDEILNSRNTLRAVFDNIPASIYILDREYTVIAVNKARAGRVGLKPNRVVGRRCFEVFYQRETPCVGCKVLETMAAGMNTQRQLCDPEEREWEISTFPILEKDSSPVGRLIVVEQDMTEKHLLEANLIHSEKLATIGQLAAGVAHEINNPLAAIIANAQLLERSLADDGSDNREMVSLISTAGDRASRVVQNLLDISRVNQKNNELVDLNGTIMKVVLLLQHKFKANSISLRLDLDQNLPHIQVRKDHIEGIMINLIMNAMDAVEGDHQEVQIRSSRSETGFHMFVQDNGRGIAREHLPHIFEPFFTTKEPGKGTGLGLAICYKTVKEYGGTIEVESEPGQGTCFHITLPVERKN